MNHDQDTHEARLTLVAAAMPWILQRPESEVLTATRHVLRVADTVLEELGMHEPSQPHDACSCGRLKPKMWTRCAWCLADGKS